jgi:deoxyribodipyrimidine photo-lyase
MGGRLRRRCRAVLPHLQPVAQGERFDPLGAYVKRWVPELAHLPGEQIHQPWTVGGVRAYPQPIVDLKRSREEALAAYASIRKS